MGDPITLSIATVGATAITEGIKFLYGQAGEILKRWHERKDKPNHEEKVPVAIVLPSVFEGQLTDPNIHFGVVADAEPTLRRLYRDLSEYATDVTGVECNDVELLRKVGELRSLIEAIFQQHITFKGENRPASGTLLVGLLRAETVAGEATAVEGQGKLQGEVRGEVNVGKVEKGGKAIGVKWDLGNGNS